MAAKQLRSTYQLKITLNGAKPPIWRRLLLTSDTKLNTLHLAIQISMGWKDSHLHQFMDSNQTFYGRPDPDFDDIKLADESKFRLSQLLQTEKDGLLYEYDFGDGWQHKIILEKILPFDAQKKLPYCVTGKRACPPEDCGGIWGYTDLLEILANPEHEEYANMIDWLGGEFDPTYLNRREINQRLLEYCR